MKQLIKRLERLAASHRAVKFNKRFQQVADDVEKAIKLLTKPKKTKQNVSPKKHKKSEEVCLKK